MDLEFSGEIIYWRGPSPFHFVTVPEEQTRRSRRCHRWSPTAGARFRSRRASGHRLQDVVVPEGRALPRADQGRRPARRGVGARGRGQGPTPPQCLRPELLKPQTGSTLPICATGTASTVRRDPLRIDQDHGTPLGAHHPVVLGPVVVRSTGGREHVAQQLRHASAVKPSGRSSGPTSRVGPSTATHSQPARNTTVARPPAASRRSFTVDPPATNPTVGRSVTGSSSTPALTTEAWTARPSASWRRPLGHDQQPRGDERDRDRRARLPAIAIAILCHDRRGE